MFFREAKGYTPTCSEATKHSRAISVFMWKVQKHVRPTAAVPYYEMRGLHKAVKFVLSQVIPIN